MPSAYWACRRVLVRETCDELEQGEDDAQQKDDEQRRPERGDRAVELGVDEEFPGEVDVKMVQTMTNATRVTHRRPSTKLPTRKPANGWRRARGQGW